MLRLLLSIATFVVAYAIDCPAGTELVAQGARGSQSSGSRPGVTIDECKEWCDCLGAARCLSFTFHPNGYAREINGLKSLCTSYRYRGRGDWYLSPQAQLSDQILCEYPADVKCPRGTSQVGERGAFGNHPIQTPISKLKITDCLQYCKNHHGCLSFTYDPHGATYAYCEIFSTDTESDMTESEKIQYSYAHHGHYMTHDQVLCKLDQTMCWRRSSAQSSGLFNLDGVSVVDGNGEVIEVPVNIIYIIIGLMCVNIVCLMACCWRNMKKNKSKYKVVSMRSDYETDNDV